MKKVLMIIIVIVLITGYTPYHELNDLAIVDMIALDKINDEYYLHLNTIESEKDEDSTDNSYLLTTIKGKSLGEVFTKAKKVKTKEAYLEHLKLVLVEDKIISKELLLFLKKSLTNINYIFIASNSSTSLILDKYKSSNKLIEKLKLEKNNNSNIAFSTFEAILSDYYNKELSLSYPVISLDKELKVDGIKVLNNNYLIDEENSITSYLLNNKINYLNKTYSDDKDYLVNIKDIRTNISYRNNKISISLRGGLSSSDLSLKELKNKKDKISNDLKMRIINFYQIERDNNFDITDLTNQILIREKDKRKRDKIFLNDKLNISINLEVTNIA